MPPRRSTLRRNTHDFHRTDLSTTTDRGLITARHLINGEWLGEADTERMNPARPASSPPSPPAARRPTSTPRSRAAAAAQPAWAALPAPARGAILMAAGNLLLDRQAAIAEDLVREEGKTLAEAKGEVKRASDVLRFFGSLGWAATGEVLPSGLPDTTITTRREAARRRRRSSRPGTSPSPSRRGRPPPR